VDLFTLKKEDLIRLERMGETSARNLVHAIETSKRISLARLIYALGIRHVGEHMARVLAARFQTLDAMISATSEELLEVNEVGPQVAESLQAFLTMPENQENLDELFAAGVTVMAEEKEAEETLFAGKTIVLTGGLGGMTRAGAKERIEAAGGRVSSAVSGQTDFVVAGDNPGSKLNKAKALGIQILDEAAFRQMLEEEGI
jgi:DNA ligase (NAD+)